MGDIAITLELEMISTVSSRCTLRCVNMASESKKLCMFLVKFTSFMRSNLRWLQWLWRIFIFSLLAFVFIIIFCIPRCLLRNRLSTSTQNPVLQVFFCSRRRLCKPPFLHSALTSEPLPQHRFCSHWLAVATVPTCCVLLVPKKLIKQAIVTSFVCHFPYCSSPLNGR